MGTLDNNSAWQQLQGHREYLRSNAENQTRGAYAYGKFKSTGWGEIAFDKAFMFGLTFLDEPFVQYGFSLNEEDTPLVDTRFPRVSGGVCRWVQDKRGYYVGAFCFCTVDTRSFMISTSEEEPNYSIDHYFTFNGLAKKDLSEHLSA